MHDNPTKTVIKYLLIPVWLYLAIGVFLTTFGYSRPVSNHTLANYEAPEGWETFDVIHDVESAHFVPWGKPRRVAEDGVGKTVYDQPRSIYLCVVGTRSGDAQPRQYLLTWPLIKGRDTVEQYHLVSNGDFLHPKYMQDSCEQKLPSTAIEIQVRSASPMAVHQKHGMNRGSDNGFKIIDELRKQDMDIPARYPEDGVPFVVQYSLRSATYWPPHDPPINPHQFFAWPEANKFVYVGFYDKPPRWRVAGVYHESDSYRPPTWKVLSLYAADVVFAPLSLVAFFFFRH